MGGFARASPRLPCARQDRVRRSRGRCRRAGRRPLRPSRPGPDCRSPARLRPEFARRPGGPRRATRRPQGEGRVTQEFSHGKAVAGLGNPPVEDVQEGRQQGAISGRNAIDQFGEQGAADDDLAAAFPLATIDGPQRLEPLDASFQHAEPLHVIGDGVQWTGCDDGRGAPSRPWSRSAVSSSPSLADQAGFVIAGLRPTPRARSWVRASQSSWRRSSSALRFCGRYLDAPGVAATSCRMPCDMEQK